MYGVYEHIRVSAWAYTYSYIKIRPLDTCCLVIKKKKKKHIAMAINIDPKVCF